MRTMMRENEDRPVGLPINGNAISCEEFQGQLPQLMGETIRNHPHLRSCARCAALLGDLEYIADIARELMQPVYEPRDLVWDNIRDRIGNADPSSASTRPASKFRS